MSFGVDDDILQDFLIEAGEIIERLSQQLVDLEQRPNDSNLLNAIFRGFHTVKGGAGFLGLTPMVECCHLTENLFDILRTGKRNLTPDLMDVVLQALDSINEQFSVVSAGGTLPPVAPSLIAALERLVCEDNVQPINNLDNKTPSSDDAFFIISDEDFARFVDAINDVSVSEYNSTASHTTSSDLITPDSATVANHSNVQTTMDDITEDEFEALLDQLHGKGKPPSAKKPEATSTVISTAVSESSESEATFNAAPITDKELQAAPETSVRVDTQRLDDIMNMVGELVLVRNRLIRLGNDSDNEALTKAIANLDVVTADLQSSVMKTRMQPIKKVFGRFPRVVRDLARTLQKDIKLELVGEETDLDKNLVEALADPLVHLVRNSVDHGIELPAIRIANGKPRTGLVVLSAEQAGDHILLCISDDGAGMDPEKLRRVAVEKGLYDEDGAARLSDNDAFNLIFAPGFSTKKEISDVSGRGVGMDVVKTQISQLNGTVEIKSELGKGTRFIIKVPLTLAIMSTLMIMVGTQTFALPLNLVNEIFHMDLHKSHVVDGQDCIVIRGQTIPLFYMKEWLVKKSAPHSRAGKAHIVIVTLGTRRLGFVVDQLIGQEEVVIKPLGKMLQGTPGMAGATITGDGTIALILDIPGLLQHYAKGATSWGNAHAL